jgi:hypothetical protein
MIGVAVNLVVKKKRESMPSVAHLRCSGNFSGPRRQTSISPLKFRNARPAWQQYPAAAGNKKGRQLRPVVRRGQIKPLIPVRYGRHGRTTTRRLKEWESRDLPQNFTGKQWTLACLRPGSRWLNGKHLIARTFCAIVDLDGSWLARSLVPILLHDFRQPRRV